MTDTKLNFRRYADGDSAHCQWQEEIFHADASHKCPTYVHRTPPCQGSCPSGHDVRDWLSITRGIDKPQDEDTGKKVAIIGGDVIKPHLLTTAIGQASIAIEGIHRHLEGGDPDGRPKVDVHHFSLLNDLRAQDLEPESYDHVPTSNTDDAKFPIHNYEDRSGTQIFAHEKLFLGHFSYTPMHRREESKIKNKDVLGNFNERFKSLTEQDAIFRVKKDQQAMGRYVDTDYGKCIGYHICEDVSPASYIDMGLGE